MKSVTRKISIAAICVLLCTVCHGQTTECAQTSGERDANWPDSVSAYRKQAWEGDADAYWKLACCYRDGKGVDQDFIKAINYAIMANEHDYAQNPETIFDELPEDNPYRILSSAMQAIGEKQYGKARQEGEKLSAMGYAGRELVNGAIARAKGQKTKALEWFDKAIGKGSQIALIAKASITEAREDLLAAAELVPWFYNEVARAILSESDYFSEESFKQAEAYLLKADEHLSLDHHGAGSLHGTYEYLEKRGRRKNDPAQMEHLRTLTIPNRKLPL